MRSSVHYVSPHDFVVRSIESRLFIRTIEHSEVYVIIVLVYNTYQIARLLLVFLKYRH